MPWRGHMRNGLLPQAFALRRRLLHRAARGTAAGLPRETHLELHDLGGRLPLRRPVCQRAVSRLGRASKAFAQAEARAQAESNGADSASGAAGCGPDWR